MLPEPPQKQAESVHIKCIEPRIRFTQLVMPFRSKKILGFQRKAGSNQARLQWQGDVPCCEDADHMAHTDADSARDDDAAMAAANNVNWELL